jgi:hypothetical protein
MLLKLKLTMINFKFAAALAAGGAALCAGYYFLSVKEKKKKAIGIVVACTGFGKFKGVSENPTEVIIKKLPVFLKTNPLDDHRIFIDRCKVLEVNYRLNSRKDIVLIMLSLRFPPTTQTKFWPNYEKAASSQRII